MKKYIILFVLLLIGCSTEQEQSFSNHMQDLFGTETNVTSSQEPQDTPREVKKSNPSLLPIIKGNGSVKENTSDRIKKSATNAYKAISSAKAKIGAGETEVLEDIDQAEKGIEAIIFDLDSENCSKEQLNNSIIIPFLSHRNLKKQKQHRLPMWATIVLVSLGSLIILIPIFLHFFCEKKSEPIAFFNSIRNRAKIFG